ncbi:hypothetical protein VSDG_05344 [Cytospora chrysosperma]|uniref:Hpc2-related domain-containing protein n=1 Tax=Cytospora chrysosperma TaxID=252740 RepID=A0A423VWS3_CYTCH|nr:hypothetical protein VSDG_05344 [Valsa sordida]
MDLNLRGGGDLQGVSGMRAFSSSPTSLSSPPSSSISNPASPSRLNVGRANIEMDEIVVDTASGPRFGVMAPPQPLASDVPLTAAGLPRKKPGRKPGSTVKPKVNPDGTPVAEAPKVRRPRKPRDPNAPPIQRKRKAATQEIPEPVSVGPNVTETTPMRMEIDPWPPRPNAAATAAASASSPSQQPNPAKAPKREGPSSMMSLLNRDSPPPPAPPVRMAFDPVRSSSYDPVRETMVTRDPYGTSALASPRAPTQMPNRASASPSISSLMDPPPPASKVVSPVPAHSSFRSTSQSRFQEPVSLPPSPSSSVRKEPPPMAGPAPKSATVEIKKPAPPSMPQPPKAAESSKINATNTPGMPAPTSMPAPSKKVAAVVAQTRKEKKPASSTSSSPKMGSLKNALPDVPPLPGTSNSRSILDFGKAGPGEEQESPSIVLHIPLNGQPNKYINFMHLAEAKYGWEALHPREAANRDRRARIAAASAALEKQQSGRDSAEEEDPEFNASEDENSNIEMGGMGNNGGLTSGADGADAAPDKPKRKRRNWREDEYDREDDFVDDSELLWEEQAAAVKDGFFVYSGPLVQEPPKAPERDGPAKRGRGRGGGPGSRGGRGGRGGGESGRGRGGGPGSRGGTTTRKPRITKLEKQKLESEKAEREMAAREMAATKSANGATGSAGSYGLLSGLVASSPSVPSLSSGLTGGLVMNP